MAVPRVLYVMVDGKWVAAAEINEVGVAFQDIRPKVEPGEAHICQCSECNPQLRHSPARLEVAHFGVGFLRDYRLLPFKLVDGQRRKQDGVYEVLCGPQGWAKRYAEPHHVCRTCSKGACAYVDSGDWSVAEV